MGFFANLYDAVKRKQVELKDRKEFLDLVETKAKPVRRLAYMEQMLKEVVKEGAEKAKADAAKRVPQKQKTESDFGLEYPYKFLNGNQKKSKLSETKK